MEQSVYQRIKNAMTLCRLNNSDLALQTGYSRQTIHQWFKTYQGMNDKAINKIIDAMPGLQKKYILLGEGPMFKKDGMVAEPGISYNASEDSNNEFLVQYLQQQLDVKEEMIRELYARLKMYENAAEKED